MTRLPRKAILTISVVLFCQLLFATDNTLVLQPDACDGKDAIVASCVPCGFHDINYGESDELSAIAWTAGGSISIIRTLLQFDLSEIPVGAVITNARLSLYHNPNANSGNPGHSQLTGTNEAYVTRITSAWDESAVTWDNQPSAAGQIEAMLLASLNDMQDYTDINLTSLIQEMVDNPSQNFGFMLQLANEAQYRSLLFASSDHPNPALRPKLEITYGTVPANAAICRSLRPASSDCSNGKDAIVGSCIPCGFNSVNYGASDELSAIAWTVNGAVSNVRGLVEFDLSDVPSNAIITSSELSLYHNPNPQSGNPGHSQLSGPNNVVLQRIVSTWDESVVTWDNQPSTTAQNEVSLPPSQNDTEDYLDIDVTDLVQGMVDNPSQSFGFMIKLKNQAYYRSLMFASSDHSDAALHPKLDICYTVDATDTIGANSILEGDEHRLNVHVYPNPLSDNAIVEFAAPIRNATIQLYDLSGKTVVAEQFSGTRFLLHRQALAAGSYVLQVLDAHRVFREKIIIQ